MNVLYPILLFVSVVAVISGLTLAVFTHWAEARELLEPPAIDDDMFTLTDAPTEKHMVTAVEHYYLAAKTIAFGVVGTIIWYVWGP